jgi:hypothetical protein
MLGQVMIPIPLNPGINFKGRVLPAVERTSVHGIGYPVLVFLDEKVVQGPF